MAHYDNHMTFSKGKPRLIFLNEEFKGILVDSRFVEIRSFQLIVNSYCTIPGRRVCRSYFMIIYFWAVINSSRDWEGVTLRQLIPERQDPVKLKLDMV